MLPLDVWYIIANECDLPTRGSLCFTIKGLYNRVKNKSLNLKLAVIETIIFEYFELAKFYYNKGGLEITDIINRSIVIDRLDIFIWCIPRYSYKLNDLLRIIVKYNRLKMLKYIVKFYKDIILDKDLITKLFALSITRDHLDIVMWIYNRNLPYIVLNINIICHAVKHNAFNVFRWSMINCFNRKIDVFDNLIISRIVLNEKLDFIKWMYSYFKPMKLDIFYLEARVNYRYDVIELLDKLRKNSNGF